MAGLFINAGNAPLRELRKLSRNVNTKKFNLAREITRMLESFELMIEAVYDLSGRARSLRRVGVPQVRSMKSRPSAADAVAM